MLFFNVIPFIRNEVNSFELFRMQSFLIEAYERLMKICNVTANLPGLAFNMRTVYSRYSSDQVTVEVRNHWAKFLPLVGRFHQFLLSVCRHTSMHFTVHFLTHDMTFKTGSCLKDSSVIIKHLLKMMST